MSFISKNPPCKKADTDAVRFSEAFPWWLRCNEVTGAEVTRPHDSFTTCASAGYDPIDRATMYQQRSIFVLRFDS